MNTLRYYQKDCITAMRKAEERFSIYKLACGTGKTNIFTTYLETTSDLNVVVLVTPRIVLLDQYLDDVYATRPKLRAAYKAYAVSSKHNPKEGVVAFAKGVGKAKLILTTKDSFQDVYTLLTEAKVWVDSVIIDEVHNFGSKKNMDFLESLDVGEILGFTATPEGPLQEAKVVYDYRHCEAVRDGYNRSFVITPYVTTDEKTPENFYKALFYFAEKEKLGNIVCYHAFSEAESKGGKSSVAQYTGIKAKVNLKGSRFTKGIRSHTITGKMSSAQRKAILDHVRYADRSELNIVHSCNTIAEGVDTQEIEGISFPDSKGSARAVTQALGRITRISETLTTPSKVFITFFGTTAELVVKDALEDSLEDSPEDSPEGSPEDSPEGSPEGSPEDSLEGSPEEVFTGSALVNHSAYRTIRTIAEFLRKDNPKLFNAALENPNILTAEEYSFHLGKIIVNKNKGDNYVGKTLEEIRERNVMVCTTDKDGDILSLGDFLDDKKTVTKETGVDNWVYLYVDAETEVVLKELGRGPRVSSPKKPSKFVTFANEEDAALVKGVVDAVGVLPKKSRLEKIEDLLDWIWDNERLPTGNDPFTSFLATLRSGKGTPLNEEEEDALTGFFKTKNWNTVTSEAFKKKAAEVFDPKVQEVDYVLTRSTRIKELFDYIDKEKRLPSHCTFFNNLRGTAKGTISGNAPLTKEETELLETGFKTKSWYLLNNKTFLPKLDEYFDDRVEEIDYEFPVTPTAPKAAAPTAAAPRASAPHHVARYRNTLLAFFEKGNADGRAKLIVLQKLKAGTRKTGGTLYPEIDEFLTGIDGKWWVATPEALKANYEDLNLEEEFDDTMSIAATVTPTMAPTVAPLRAALSVDSYLTKKLPVVQERRDDAAEIILDYDDALSSECELEDHLKEEVWALYKAKNPRLLQYMKNHKITAEQFLEHVA